MNNQVCKLLNIQYPIFQGAMTNVSDSQLVTAVSNAGGLGIFAPGIESVDLDWVREQIRTIQAGTPNAFAVNVMLASPFAAEIVKIICEEKVPAVTTGAGSPAKFMDQFRAAGVKVIPVVSTVRAALKMEAAGADAVVVSGMEGGGYIGHVCTLPLIPQVVDAVHIPVIAAGGFADGRGLAAALMLGAQGIQMGTRFLTTEECNIPDWCKKALLDGGSEDAVVLGNRIGVNARLRVLGTACVKNILASEGAKDANVSSFEESVTNARNAKYDDGLDGTLIGAGQSLGLVDDQPTVKELIDRMIQQYNAIRKETL